MTLLSDWVQLRHTLMTMGIEWRGVRRRFGHKIWRQLDSLYRIRSLASGEEITLSFDDAISYLLEHAP